jgi:hypothetical protein
MPAMIDKKCKHCKSDITVRLADHNRGWGNFCNKSCKAKYQEKRNGQYAAYQNGRGVSNLHPERLKEYDREGMWYDDSDPVNAEWKECHDDTHPFSSEGLGQWID